MIGRDLGASADARIDDDWRFAIAYNAALQCAAVALKASGHDVAKGAGAHYRTIESLRLTLGDDGTLVEVLQAFRAKRGGAVYETTGIASKSEIEELRSLAIELHARLMRWLRAEHSQLLATSSTTGNKSRRKRR